MSAEIGDQELQLLEEIRLESPRLSDRGCIGARLLELGIGAGKGRQHAFGRMSEAELRIAEAPALLDRRRNAGRKETVERLAQRRRGLVMDGDEARHRRFRAEPGIADGLNGFAAIHQA